jgi:hypothetical protein
MGHIVHAFIFIGSMNIFHRESVICNDHFVDLFIHIDVLSILSFIIFAGQDLI